MTRSFIQRTFRGHTATRASFNLGFSLFLGIGIASGSTYDFGYLPVGASNLVSGFHWNGGSFNGTQVVMTVETIIGPNAAAFSASPNYAGQTLQSGRQYPYSMSFSPQYPGFETATLTNFDTPSPPFGAGAINLQGAGFPPTRPASGPIVPELAPLEKAMTNFLATHQFAAGTLALMYNSKLVFRQGYGWRDTNFTTVIHPDNLFRLASVSKKLAASAIYKLVAAGKITTGTKVYSYLGIPPWGGVLGDARITDITVQNLLDYSGGWDASVSPVGDGVFSTIEISTALGLSYPAAPTNVISWMFSKPLDFTPGTTNVYSDFGYQVLGRVVEKAGAKPFVNYIQEDLLGGAGITNALGFANVVQSRSRPGDLAPWEIWYADQPQFLPRSAVDYPANLAVRYIDGGDYYESYDSFGGLSASGIGLCHYLLNYLEGYYARPPGAAFAWNASFFGSLPGATSVLFQHVAQTSTTTNGLEFAALFNERDDSTGLDNSEALAAILAATNAITSWPTNGGGMIQWAATATNVNNTSGGVTVPLARSGAPDLPVKVSFTTYGLTAGSSDYVSTSGIVTFAAGVTNRNVTIPLLNDGVAGPARQFSLELISASGGAWLGDNLTSIVTILNTNTTPAFIGPPALLPNGNFQVQLRCAAGLVLTVERSTNLLDWRPWQTFSNPAFVTLITDTNVAAGASSFYRAVVP